MAQSDESFERNAIGNGKKYLALVPERHVYAVIDGDVEVGVGKVAIVGACLHDVVDADGEGKGDYDVSNYKRQYDLKLLW